MKEIYITKHLCDNIYIKSLTYIYIYIYIYMSSKLFLEHSHQQPQLLLFFLKYNKNSKKLQKNEKIICT
jgi:hypothetical protein